VGGWMETRRPREAKPGRKRANHESAGGTGERYLEMRNGEIPEFELSRWSRSQAKRIFDVAAVLLCSPILLPLLAIIAAAVLITSGAPVIFRQYRIGRDGVPFTIYKFRTMRPSHARGRSAIAIESASRITWLGFLLRRTKLDELPQLFNVLTGEMSLVGSRPKVPEQQLWPLPCRPGLTGAATLAFAREESILMPVPLDALAAFFQDSVLPAKHELDIRYMRDATLRTDMRILTDTVLGRWKSYACTVQWPNEQDRREEPCREILSICP
jgi:lipopolysaccharide/colanic/teichoic acid biosynthesis glycosyltransferase